MRSRQRIERVLARAGRATPVAVRGPLGRATRALRGRWQGTRVTVVVAVSDDETVRIDPCLNSVRAQTHSNIDVLVVPFGAAEGVTALARRHAAEDWRIRVQPAAANRAEAWNAGAARAAEGYLLFVRGCDDLPTQAVQRLVTALDESGSAMAVGRIEPPITLHAAAQARFQIAHRSDLYGTTLRETPLAVTDLGVGNRMLRRGFWAEAGLRFDPGDRLGTEFALASYARAGAFDLLTDPVYVPTGRREGVSVGAMRDVVSELDTWLAEHRATQHAVAALDLPEVLDWWLWDTLDTEIQPFIGDVERATDGEWARLRSLVVELLEAGGEASWASLRAESRVKLWLVRADRRPELEEYVTARLFERSHRPTEVRDGVVLAHLPFFSDSAVGIPDDVFEMRETETPLRASLLRIRWSGPERLVLDGHARIDHVDLGPDTEISAWLVERGTGERIALPVRRYDDPRANQFDGSRYQDYAAGGFTAEVDTAALARRAVETARQVAWTLQFRVRTRGLERRGPLTEIDTRASAGMVETGHLGDRRTAGAKVGLRGRSASRFRLVAEPSRGPELVEAAVTASTVDLTFAPGSEIATEVRARDAVGVVARARVVPSGERATARLDLARPRPGDPARRLQLVVAGADGRERPLGWPVEEQWLAAGSGDVVLSRSETGDADVIDVVGTLVAEEVALDGDCVELRGRWLGVAPSWFSLALVQGRVRLPAECEQTADGVRARIRLRWDEWGLGESFVPGGGYAFELEHGSARRPYRGRVLVGQELLDRLLDFTVTADTRFRVQRKRREAGVVLLPPLTDDDRGPLPQARLQAWYRDCDLPIDESAVYLQSYAGASATDSQLAIHHELRRARPDLTIYWGVADSASSVPEGGVPLLLNSAAWYRVLATARYLCLNIDPERWFALRPGQQLLQTFHGYPAKSMGIRMWEAKGYTPRRIDLELDRTSRDWSLILTPAPEMDEHYRREYRYDGPIHAEGYPRDDLLVSPDAARVREETRRRLGIGPGQRAVLYAPTWRDDLATNWRKAEVADHLDVVAASRRLGRDYVLLMRGHRFHQPAQRDGADAQLVDVTHYPEINDLILAADAAVLDYSSLRFDFALTGRPMIFLVPDLAAYTGGVRGFLYPFEESAPGPMVSTSDQVIELLRDLEGLGREHAEAIRAFNERFNYLQDGRSAEKVVRAFFDSGADGSAR